MIKNLKQTIAFILSALIICTLFPMPTAQALLSPSVTLGSPNLIGGKYYYESAVVAGSGIRTILINFSDEVTSGDAITLPAATTGFTVSGSSNDYTKRINIDSGIDTSAVQSYLRDVGFSLGSNLQTVQVVVSSEDIRYDTYYNAATQHYYQFVPLKDANETWITSYNAAKGMTYMGRTGYLATVTSLQEDSFIMALSGEVGWLGGTRMGYNSVTDSFNTTTTTGYWYWANGPEKGSHFYDAQYVTLADYATKDTENAAYYFNWNRPSSGDREPNSNLAYGETCLTTLHIGTGYAGTNSYSWNDRDHDANYWDDITSVYQPHGYVVEYGDSITGDSGSGSSAFATASSTLSAPVQLTLGDASFSTDTNFSFSGLTLLSPNNIGVVTISVNKAAASGATITLPADAATPGGAPIVVTDLNNLTKTVIFASAQSAASVQAYLRAVVFNASPDGAQTVIITADANTTAGLSSDMKLTAFYNHPDNTIHYYTYVSSSLVTWVEAYNAAKNIRFMGMTGYLPTVTSLDENAILTNISTDAAWSGGTRLVFNGANSTTDGMQISDQGTLNISSFTKADTDEKDYFYWACGPEAGLAYSTGKKYSDSGFGLIDSAFETVFSDTPWGINQPDNYAYSESTTEPCMQVNQPNTLSGSTVYLWNDLPLFLTGHEDEKRYYFVEFGGYTGTTNSIKQVTNDPGSPDTFLTASSSALVSASYTITYNLDGGTNPGGTPAGYTYGTGATLPTPTKTGFTFGGWYTDSGFSGSAMTSINTADTGNKTYWAKWSADTYAITYNLDGGTNPGGATAGYTYGTGATLPTPTKTGFTFSGWYTDSGFSGSTMTLISTTDTGNKTYWAKWSADTYAITYNLDGGTNPGGAPAGYTYGTGATLPTPTKTGFTFGGWYTDSGFSGSVMTSISTSDTGIKVYYAKWTAAANSDDDPPSRTITVTETSSELFAGSSGMVLAVANVNNAFSSSVEVKVTDTKQEGASFGFGSGTKVYPFDISLYIKGTNTKTEPASGYAVTISLPIPADLLDVKEQLSIVHKSDGGTVATLVSCLKQVNGIWYLVFDAKEFSPYALVVSNLTSYDTAAGLPYYLDDSGRKVFIGFAADGKYLSPDGVTVVLTPNPKTFTDISTHWGKMYIDFVTEREIFVGTGTHVFSPDMGMTRSMFATVIGRLYERSYGEISISDARAFIDCNYNDYYGKYVDWAAEKGIIQGVGGGLFQPDRQVSRQEMATMLYRFADFMKLSTGIYTDVTLNYTDASNIAFWAEDAALYCQETGIITGRTGGCFAPTETAIRAEVAAIIQRFVKLAIG